MEQTRQLVTGCGGKVEKHEKTQTLQVAQPGSLSRRASGNDGIERVRKAREQYVRRCSGAGFPGTHYILPCLFLCVGIGFLVTGMAVAAPEDTLVIEAFPQPSGQDPAAEALQEEGPPPSMEAPQLAGPPQASVAVQAPGVGQAPRQTEDRNSTDQHAGTLVAAETGYRSLGAFEITGYCSCDSCCGVKEVKLTKSETVPRSSHTVAADLEVLPLGTRIMIDGVIYTVEDTGKAIRGHIVDIFFDSHQEALEFGRQEKTVYLVE